MLVRMRLARIIMVDPDEQHIIVLRETKGDRVLPIVIGRFEALAIDRRVKHEPTSRPMTHDLMLSIIEQMGGDIEKVVIHDLQNGTYFARLMIRRNGEVVEVDSRPSDAIAVAAGQDVPLFVEESVLRDEG